MKKFVSLLVVVIIFAGCRSTQVVHAPQINEAELGKEAFDKESYQQAVEYYDQWLAKYPNDAVVLMERGRANRQLKKYSEALEDFEKAIAVNTKDLAPKVYQCNILLILNKTKEARANLDAIMANPMFQRLGIYEKFLVYYMDGQIKNTEDSYEKALVSLEEALKTFDLYPHIFRTYKSPFINRFVIYQRAVAYHGINDYPKAAEEMTKYIELSKEAGAEVTSKDYKSLALALYMAENLAKCKAVLPNVSPEDRKDLQKALGDSIFSAE